MSPRTVQMVPQRRMALAILLPVLISLASLGSLPAAGTVTIETYYAPEDLPAAKLVELYGRAQRYIYVAVYGFTYPPAVKALIAAKRRGLDVRVITDREKLNDPKQERAVETLRLAGIPVRVNQHDGLMHLKQVVVDDEVTASGSMNHTTSGNQYNDERLDVITDHDSSVKAKEKFLAMWQDPVRYRAWR